MEFIEFLFEEDERDTYLERYNSSKFGFRKLRELFNRKSYKKVNGILRISDKDICEDFEKR